jgi:subfamily B ATP-binding cassette protein MsbA
VESFKRLIPYIWPYRRKLALSVVFGVLVAILWGANLSAAFPIITVLLQQDNLHELVDRNIENAQKEIERRNSDIVAANEQIAKLTSDGLEEHDPNMVSALAEHVRLETKRQDESQSLLWWQWTKCYVMPWIPRNPFHTFALVVALLLLATLLKGFFIYLQDVLVGSVAESAVMRVRKRLLRRVLRLDLETLSAQGTGELMSRFTYDTEQLAGGVTLLGGRLIREPLKCLACAVLALIINWRLTLLSLFFVPILAAFFLRFGRTLKRASKKMMESMSRIYKVLEETFEARKIVIAFGSSRRHREQFQNEYQRYFDKALQVVRTDALAKPSMEMLGLVALFVAMLPGAYLVIRAKTSIYGIRLASDVMDSAQLGTLYAMLAGMLDPCRKLSTTYSRIKRSAAAADRVFALMDMKPKVREVENAAPLARHKDSIEFRDVKFRYPVSNESLERPAALSQINLKIEARQVVAIVGPNGCGKSTLLNLIPRFYDPTEGELRIDDTPISHVSLDDLREQIGIVTQDTMLFDDTIAGNILYGRPTASREDVEEAARRAYVTQFSQALPLGLETRVGEKGKDFSGGQRQRIALARAILRDPAILILDEATSAADAESESLILRALKDFSAGRTVLIITHSMSPALLALIDRIVVMDDSRIVGDGTHEQLLKECPLYDRLYHAPSRDGRAAA